MDSEKRIFFGVIAIEAFQVLLSLIPAALQNFRSTIDSSSLTKNLTQNKYVAHSVVASIAISIPIILDFICDIVEFNADILEQRSSMDAKKRVDVYNEWLCRLIYICSLVIPSALLYLDISNLDRAIIYSCLSYTRDLTVPSAILFGLYRPASKIWTLPRIAAIVCFNSLAFLAFLYNIGFQSLLLSVLSPIALLLGGGLFLLNVLISVYDLIIRFRNRGEKSMIDIVSNDDYIQCTHGCSLIVIFVGVLGIWNSDGSGSFINSKPSSLIGYLILMMLWVLLMTVLPVRIAKNEENRYYLSVYSFSSINARLSTRPRSNLQSRTNSPHIGESVCPLHH